MSVCEIMSAQLGALFRCDTMGDGFTRVRTPFLYPDGGVIDLFYTDSENVPTFSDLGETLRWLGDQTVSSKRTPKQNRLIADICMNHGLEFLNGTLSTRVKPQETAAAAAIRAAQGMLRVADLWFTTRTRSFETVTDEVEEFLLERKIPYQRNQTFDGRSGRVWRVDFHTRTPKRSSLVYVLSTGSSGAAKGIVEHTTAVWHDLSHQKFATPELQFVSLFDDTLDVWSAQDFKLVDDLSQVVLWSNPEDFAERLAG